MKKSILAISALAAMLFAGCTSSDELTTMESIKNEKSAPEPIQFGTYLGKTSTRTTGGTPGLITTASLQTGTHSAAGFGVFGYYTDHSDYNASTSPVNYMYNQQVTYSTAWTYSPLKYWPNETNATYSTSGSVDGGSANGGATSTQGPDKLSFFAYAPYVSVTPSTGNFASTPDDGITALTSNTTNGDPKINYTLAADADNTVDLLWGVVPAENTYNIVSGTPASHTQTPTAGLPNINLTKQIVTEKVEFLFKHALAKLTFSVQGAFDEVTPSSNDVDGFTRIVIESVTIATEFHKNGILNLNNLTAAPNWSTSGDALITFNINNDDIVGTTPASAGLKYNSSTDTYDGQPLGVTKTKQYLMDADGTSKFFTVIPEDDKDITITIVYHVFTKDTNLDGGYSKVTNTITKTIDNFDAVGGNSYNINMILGMTSLKFNATVNAWGGESTTPIDLPINVD